MCFLVWKGLGGLASSLVFHPRRNGASRVGAKYDASHHRLRQPTFSIEITLVIMPMSWYQLSFHLPRTCAHFVKCAASERLRR